MTQGDAQKFGPITVELRHGGQAVVRPLTRRDADALARFYERVPHADYRFYCPHPLDGEHAAANAANASSPHEIVLVFEPQPDTIEGYAWCRWSTPDAAWSTFGICVSRAWQGHGVGRALMTRLLEIARDIAPPVMRLTVQEANPHAVKLYQGMGFHIVKKKMRPVMLGTFPPEPEYSMELRLRP